MGLRFLRLHDLINCVGAVTTSLYADSIGWDAR